MSDAISKALIEQYLLVDIQSSIRQGARDDEGPVDVAKAQADAQALFDAGEAKWGTDEEVFNRVSIVLSSLSC